MVIVAGYTEPMERFIHSNPGLESRFNRFLHFPDYTAQELAEIFELRCKGSGYILANDARPFLLRLLEQGCRDPRGFGNARGVRNLFERTVSALRRWGRSACSFRKCINTACFACKLYRTRFLTAGKEEYFSGDCQDACGGGRNWWRRSFLQSGERIETVCIPEKLGSSR